MAFNAGSIDATLTLNRNPFTAGIAAARNQARSLANERFKVTVKIDVDRASLNQATRDLQSFIKNSRAATAKVNVDRLAFDKLVVDLRKFGMATYTAKAKVDTSDSSRQLNSLVGLLGKTGSAATRMGGDTHRAFRYAHGGVRILLAALPLILPVAAAAITGVIGLVGALTSILGTAAAGVGAFALVATSVFKSISLAANDAGGQTEKAISALKQVGTAHKAYSSAVRSANDANAAAAKRVENAERALASAQLRAQRAQEDLTQARRDAIEELEDLKLSLRGAALSEEQAVLDLEEAQIKFNEALTKGVKGNELKQLELDVRQAKLSVDESRESYGDAQQAAAEFARTGIDGSKGVRQAQEKVNDANADIRESERDLATARQEQTQTMRDGQDKIAEALEALREAEANYTKESIDNTILRTAAFLRSVEALKEVKSEYDALVKRTQDPVADAMTSNFRAASQFLKTLDPLVTSTATAFTQIGDMAREYFGSEHWTNFVDVISKKMVPTLTKLFEIFAYGARAVENLVIAFGPLGDWLLDALVQGMKDFAEWTEKLGKDPNFQKFIEMVKENLPKVWYMLGQVVEFLFRLSMALTPVGGVIAEVLGKIFEGLNKLPPEWLAAIGLGIAGIMGALILGASGPVALGIGALLGAAAALAYLYTENENVRKSFDGFVNWIKAEWQPIWDKIKENFEKYIQPAWDKLVETAEKHLPRAFEAIKKAYEEHIKPTFGPLIDSLTGEGGLIPAFLEFADMALPHVVDAVSGAVTDIAALIGGLITVFTGVFTIIAGIFTFFTGLFTGDWEKMGEGLKKISEGFWTAIAGIFGLSLDELKAKYVEWDVWLTTAWHDFWNKIFTSFETSRLEIGSAIDKFWKGIGSTILDIINWVIREVLNKGVLDSWNTVMGWIGADGLKAELIKEIPGYAQGGKVYGPGTGTSDSVLARVSKDEYIMPANRARNHMHFLEALRQGQPEAVQAAGGPNNPSPYPGYAAGGVAAGMDFARAQVGKPYKWGGVGPGSYDCSGIVSAVARSLMGLHPYQRIGTTGTAPWPGWQRGLTSAFGVGYFSGSGVRNPGHMASTLAGTNIESAGGVGVRMGGNAWGATHGRFGNSHFSLPSAGGVFTPGAGGGGGGSAILQTMWEHFGTQVESLLNGLLNFGAMPGNGSLIGNAITQIPTKIIPIVFGKLKDMMSKLFFSDPNAPGSTGGNAGAGVQQWAQLVRTALGHMGLGTALTDTVLRRMQQESSGDPRAINNWDANARMGWPTKGLMQMRDDTYQSNRDPTLVNDIWDPFSNIVASMRYAIKKYGSLPAAYNKAGGYGKGGFLEPGEGAYNETGRREAIFNDQQLQRMGSPDPESIRELVRAIVAESEATGVRIGTIVLPNGASVKELAEEVGFNVRQVGKGRYRK